MRCDLRIDAVLFGTAYYAVILFPLSLFLVFLVRAVSRSVKPLLDRWRLKADQ